MHQSRRAASPSRETRTSPSTRRRISFTSVRCSARRDTSQLLAISRRASGAGLSFVAQKAQLYAAIVAQTTGDDELGTELLRDCVPRPAQAGAPAPPRAGALPQTRGRGARSGERAVTGSRAAPHGRSSQPLGLCRARRDADARRPGAGGAGGAGRRKRASDDVLARVLAVTQGIRGGDLARAVEAALKQRPGVRFVPGPVFPQLTKRERQVLGLMAEGRRNPGDRRRALPLPPHREDARHAHLQQAGRRGPRRGHPRLQGSHRAFSRPPLTRAAHLHPAGCPNYNLGMIHRTASPVSLHPHSSGSSKETRWKRPPPSSTSSRTT